MDPPRTSGLHHWTTPHRQRSQVWKPFSVSSWQGSDPSALSVLLGGLCLPWLLFPGGNPAWLQAQPPSSLSPAGFFLNCFSPGPSHAGAHAATAGLQLVFSLSGQLQLGRGWQRGHRPCLPPSCLGTTRDLRISVIYQRGGGHGLAGSCCGICLGCLLQAPGRHSWWRQASGEPEVDAEPKAERAQQGVCLGGQQNV